MSQRPRQARRAGNAANDAYGTSRRLQAALDAGVPVTYFNGFACVLSTGDVAVVVERNNVPVGILNMSFTIAKSLSVSLGGTVSTLESISQRDMLTTFDLEKVFNQQEQSDQ